MKNYYIHKIKDLYGALIQSMIEAICYFLGMGVHLKKELSHDGEVLKNIKPVYELRNPHMLDPSKTTLVFITPSQGGRTESVPLEKVNVEWLKLIFDNLSTQ